MSPKHAPVLPETASTHLVPPALRLQQPEPESSPVLILQDQVEPLDPFCAPVGLPLYEQLLRAPAGIGNTHMHTE
jgi:hypothetical protein